MTGTKRGTGRAEHQKDLMEGCEDIGVEIDENEGEEGNENSREAKTVWRGCGD